MDDRQSPRRTRDINGRRTSLREIGPQLRELRNADILSNDLGWRKEMTRNPIRTITFPHRNRTRGLGGLLCAFYNGRDARCDSCGRDARHPDKGRDAWCPCYAAKMAAFPVRPRQARPLPWRRSRGDRPTGGCSPYTEGLGFLHGETASFARYVTYCNK